MVYVISKDGNPLMPTKRHRKVRLWLKNGQAKIVSHEPFTIQLLFATGRYIEELTLGMDPGYSEAGLSVISNTQEYLSAEAKLRTDVSKLMTEKKMYRVTRRGRNTRYRPARFLNRKKTQVLPPSIHQKVESHITLIEFVKKILPIAKEKEIIEGNKFDPQKLENPEIQGKEYQQGDQYGFQNTRAYVLARDKHTCYFASPKGKKHGFCQKKLNTHHIKEKAKGGSDAPFNLITLCKKHHGMLHDGKLSLGKVKHKSYKAATAMNIVRNQIFKRLSEASMTHGYITKTNRWQLGLEKSHSNDAFVIAGGTTQTRCKTIYLAFKRKNNRCLQLNRKGFKPSIRKRRYPIQPKDLVKWNGKIYQAKGTQNKGKYVLLDDGKKPKPIKDVELVFHRKTLYLVANG